MTRISFGPARFVDAKEAAACLGESVTGFNWQRSQRPDKHPPYMKRYGKIVYWTPHLEDHCMRNLRNTGELTAAE